MDIGCCDKVVTLLFQKIEVWCFSAVDLERTGITIKGLQYICDMLRVRASAISFFFKNKIRLLTSKDNETLLQIRVGRSWKDPAEKAMFKKIAEIILNRRRAKFAEFTMSKLETGVPNSALLESFERTTTKEILPPVPGGTVWSRSQGGVVVESQG